MPLLNSYITYAIILAVIIAIVISLIMVLKSPFQYPYYNCYLDVTGKRKPQIDNLIDQLLNSGKFNEFQAHNKKILLWKEKCNKQIDNSKLKKYRRSQFDKCIDDDNAFKFYLTRQQTRYKQRNYVKKAYKVTQTVNAFFCNYEYLQNRDRALQRINHECTLSEYHSKNQRKLMTKDLRKKIMYRDHYTCQNCGKYMPDEVGLHIDHIVPVSKGGKTISSNLQVLCSKCNGSKSNRVLKDRSQ
ncbi:MAG: HNH endonuclease [Clostridia bacterium]